MTTETRQLLLLVLLAAALFSVNINGYDLWPADEPRFAEVAREMRLSGDYLVPMVNGEPYKEKPPLLFWSIAAVSIPFGEVTAASARIPSVFSAILVVALTFLLARRLFGERVALWAALILMTGLRFWWQARTAQIDMLLTACMTVSLYAFWRHHEENRGRWVLLFYLGMAAGVYAKGPPALVFPLLLAVTFYWGRKKERHRLHLVWGVAAVAVLIALWLIPARLAAAGMQHSAAQQDIGANLFRQTIGRMFLGVSKAQWPWYYFQQLPADLFPWSVFAPWVLYWVWKHRRDGDAMRLLLSWTLPAFIFFSMCVGKRAIYILPLYPAFAILIARSVIVLMDSPRVCWKRNTVLVYGAILLAVSAAIFGLRYGEYGEAARQPVATFYGVAVLAFAIDALFAAFRPAWRPAHATVAAHFGILSILAALMLFPLVNEYKSAKPFCRPLRELTGAGVDYRLYSVGFSRAQYVFYSEHFHKPVMMGDLPREVLDGHNLRELARAQKTIRKSISKAVDNVPLRSHDVISEAEREALRSAVKDALARLDIDPEQVDLFQRIANRELADLVEGFLSDQPAFLFVQQNDWRWLVLLDVRLNHMHIVNAEGVGSREVLLIGNDTGAAALERLYGPSAAQPLPANS